MIIRKNFFSILILAISLSSLVFFLNRKQEKHKTGSHHHTATIGSASIPSYVYTIYEYIQQHHASPSGFEGGRIFHNREHHLPPIDHNGAMILYHEWDVHPHERGMNRGAERLITGDDGSAYYTRDHYNSFQPVLPKP